MNVPDDSLICPITLELFRDPVLAQDGHTYERQAIVQWIERNGRSPITDQPLSLEHLYPNYAIKKAVDHFEKFMKSKKHQYALDVDVKRRAGRPLFQTFGKAIYYADWIPSNKNRPEIILLKVDGARAKKEASFYVDLSQHPHIVRTYGLVYDPNDEENNAIMLLQEHASMGSLYDFLQERKKAPEEKILVEIFLQIIDAMAFLAFNNVVHADLACRNVLVFRFDENDRRNIVVKVTDFGLSRYSSLYSMAPGAAKTTLNIIPVRYVAPEILSPHVTPDDYTEKSDVYSMGVLMWEAYNRGVIPWSKISEDSEVIRRIINGELLPKPSNCSDLYWSIICKTWARKPEDRPTFAELKYLLAEQSFNPSNSTNSFTTTLPRSTEEFRMIERQFLDGWPNELRRQIRVEEIHKINNPALESKYQQFVRSNPNFATRECIGWHGTSARCHNGRCMSPACTLCQIVRNGFNKDCARKNTSSYSCWGANTYFATKSFVCHTYNGASQLDETTLRRCTIMSKINRGHTINREKIKGLHNDCVVWPSLLKTFKYDSLRFDRDYYIAPVDYILVSNNLAVLPIYIVQYAYETRDLQIRSTIGKYCSFHNEYHKCGGVCDGHYGPMCLGQKARVNDKSGDSLTNDCNTFEKLTGPEGSHEIDKILEIVRNDVYP